MAATAAQLERRCRICAADRDAGVMIFGSRGHQMMLRDSIKNFLHVEVTLDDRLPKMVCIKCCTQIDSIRIFADMARQSQITLMKHLESIDMAAKDEHTLETDANENDCSPSEDDTDDVTKMEVRVDPMMFFDSHTDESQTDDSQCYADASPDEDRATLIKIEKQPTVFKIEPVQYPDQKKTEDKRTKSLPDLKPIKTNKRSGQGDVRPYVCVHCPRSFFSNIALLNHMWLHSNKDSGGGGGDPEPKGKITCPICRKDMSSKKTLKVHLETHRPRGKYNCDICGRVFKTSSNLFRHKQYHGSEIYTCKVCGRVYPTNSTLRAHSVTHSDARPHNCPLCKKTFKRNQDLKFHINQHTGARPYRCPYCPKAFASSGNCFSHRKRMHPAEVERDREKSAMSDSLS